MPAMTHKRGDTFRQALTHLAGGKTPVDLTGWTITSQVRDSTDALVATLTISNRSDAAGLFVVSASDTTTWPVGTLAWDIQYTDADGVIRSTQTIDLTVVADVTRA